MSPATRRIVNRLPRERRESDILAAATTVFGEQGYDNASMSEIAASAGVVEGTIYKYFDNKRDLLLRVLTRWYESMLASYEDQLGGIRGTESRLRYVIWRHLSVIALNPALCRVFFREVRTSGDYGDSALFDLNRRYTHFIVEILREGVASGDLDADLSIPLVRDVIYGAIEHHTWKFVCGVGTLDVETTADQLTRLIMRGIAAKDPETRLARTADRLERLATSLEEARR
ncbi:AcrR family transcriptional regulator [Rhodoligotrophos appendicifer]|uniref:TetR/AcrR family transcriptional regulator n=1 Tax=Rhodoligotrophos appendicifer TaxID=987056 RepID=UPI001184A9A6|nr:TetR/AcrR family transcriptional regulator [Rhodoligotrophos appendicifer]